MPAARAKVTDTHQHRVRCDQMNPLAEELADAKAAAEDARVMANELKRSLFMAVDVSFNTAANTGVCFHCIHRLTKCDCQQTQRVKEVLSYITGGGGGDVGGEYKRQGLLAILMKAYQVGSCPPMMRVALGARPDAAFGARLLSALASQTKLDTRLLAPQHWLIELLHTRLGMALSTSYTPAGGYITQGRVVIEGSICGVAMKHYNWPLVRQLLAVIPGDVGDAAAATVAGHAPTLLATALELFAEPDIVHTLTYRTSEPLLNDYTSTPQQMRFYRSPLFAAIRAVNHAEADAALAIRNLETLLRLGAHDDGSGLDICGQEEPAIHYAVCYNNANNYINGGPRTNDAGPLIRAAATRVRTYRASLVPTVMEAIGDSRMTKDLAAIVGAYVLPPPTAAAAAAAPVAVAAAATVSANA